ncbi:MAG TPA: hypothetical protein VFI23_11700 [Rhizomicrobium sp.]|nr:hypothetical protein [Rhizomicrobium sp.]
MRKLILSLMLVVAAALADPTSASAELARNVVAYLDFFARWDTPEDDRAAETFHRLMVQAPDFATFDRLAPQGSVERARFERHLASIDEGARLVRQDGMSRDLFLEGWYAMPAAWDRARPIIFGLRAQRHDPGLFANIEWLAPKAMAYWKIQETNPPLRRPIEVQTPTADDRAIFTAFQRIWSTPRDAEAQAFWEQLVARPRSFGDFQRFAPKGTAQFTHFDRLMCAYDQAGALMKFGLLHPALFFGTWRSPEDIWRDGGPWVRGLRAGPPKNNSYDNVDWLVTYERHWRSAHPNVPAKVSWR